MAPTSSPSRWFRNTSIVLAVVLGIACTAIVVLYANDDGFTFDVALALAGNLLGAILAATVVERILSERARKSWALAHASIANELLSLGQETLDELRVAIPSSGAARANPEAAVAGKVVDELRRVATELRAPSRDESPSGRERQKRLLEAVGPTLDEVCGPLALRASTIATDPDLLVGFGKVGVDLRAWKRAQRTLDFGWGESPARVWDRTAGVAESLALLLEQVANGPRRSGAPSG